jgi:hypothetical protein
LFCFCNSISISQVYSGVLINSQNNQPIPYANIGIVGKNIGTTSDANGFFNIILDSKFDKETLCISSIGFESREYVIGSFKQESHNDNKIQIFLVPKTYTLAEVVIKPVKIKFFTLGNFCDPVSCYGNAFYSKQLGTEIGVRIIPPSMVKKTYINTFRFYVGEFTFNSFPVRLNIYNLNNGLPFENILKEPIFIEIKDKGEYNIDLSKMNIAVEGGFFISLEYYQIADEADGKLLFCAVHAKRKKQGNDFYRFTSQGEWMAGFGDCLGFSVQVECDY